MRTTMLAVTAVAIGAVACSSTGKTASKKDDFSNDLRLASATTMDLAAPKVNPALLTLETAPHSAPAPAPTIKKGAGELAVQSEAPTVEAAPEPTPAAVVEAEPVAEAPAPAPVPEPTPEPVAVAPRPTPPAAIPAGGNGGGDYGTGSGAGGVGGVLGGIIGAVIRGGGVDGDHCEPHGRRGGVYTGRPVYTPTPMPRTVIVRRVSTVNVRGR